MDNMNLPPCHAFFQFYVASKNDDNSKVVAEAADFLYHMMVLLAEKGVKLSEVCSELYKRNK